MPNSYLSTSFPPKEKPKISLITISSFVAGVLLGSVVTRVVFLSANWETCRSLGIETAFRCPQANSHRADTYGAESHFLRANGTYNTPSPFKGPPTREVDRAWERYWEVWLVGVDEDAFRTSMPQYPDAAVRLGGEDGEEGRYLATFEATHQLHCLYNLFRASYLDGYPEERAEYNRDPERWHERVDHCVDILRQKLQCDRDTTPVTYNWVRGKRDPTANFNVARVCPDWAGLEVWARQHQATLVPTKPHDAVELAKIP